MESRQLICRSTIPTYAQTKVTSRHRGQYIRMTATSNLTVRANPPSRYGENPDCKVSLTYYEDTSTICCNTPNTTLFARGCSDHPSCRSFYVKKNCNNVLRLNSSDKQNPEKCFSATDLIRDQSAGVIVCKADDLDDSHSATLNYIPSIPLNMCPRNTKPIEQKLYVNMEDPPTGDDMLQLCEPEQTEIYVGQIVNFQCHGSYYYFSGGFRWILKSYNGTFSSAEFLVMQEERLGFSSAPSEQTIIKSTRSLETNIEIKDKNIYELVCLAPVWNSFDWVNKSIRLNIKDSTPIIFDGVVTEEIISFSNNFLTNCSASGDPTPIVYWEFPGGLGISSKKNIGWATIQFPDDVSAFPDSFNISCRATQLLIQNRTATKYFHFKKEVKLNPLIYLSFLLLLLIPVIFGIIYLFWKTIKDANDTIRDLTPKEVDEFLNGNYDPDALKITVNRKAILMPYDRVKELSSKHLIIGGILDEGFYGIVRWGTFKNRLVALKTCKPKADILYFKAFLCELKLMIYLGHHDNLVNLVGARTKNIIRKREVYIVTEFCANGNLKNFLKKNRIYIADEAKYAKNSNSRTHYVCLGQLTFSPYDLLKWAKEIAHGMAFLSSRNVIHSDLAARNIFLTENLIAKIGDFGLSHQLVNYAIYVPKYKMPMPAKWLAPECLQNFELSISSDVWAYGVTLWEMFSLGDDPWKQYSDSDVVGIRAALSRGERLNKPKYATEEIYNKIVECWDIDPSKRPTFQSLVQFFDDQFRLYGFSEDNLKAELYI